MYAIEMVSHGIISIPSFMKIGTGVQAILRFCLINLKTVMLVILMKGIFEVCR
jgi:hypothetical protein